ncbi:MAG: membrane integrity-associated transporter subunit PqiC [Deltaproteobacteria bacterium]|nr:membrane integrity-associated transporter subunit PqiC [Deltaproteobacteria bacterium]
MLRDKKLLILMLGAILPLTACLNLKQPKNRIDYYTLEYEPPSVKNQPTLPYVIKVDHFSVAPVYNSNRIIYRDKSYKRQAYNYHHWRVNPADFVTYFLSRDMKQSGLFQAVLPRDSRFPSFYLLEGVVDDFFELDRDNGWEAVLSVSIAFMNEVEPDISKKILLQKIYSTSKPCEQKNPRALARAMSQAMSEVSGKIIHDVYEVLKNSRRSN